MLFPKICLGMKLRGATLFMLLFSYLIFRLFMMLLKCFIKLPVIYYNKSNIRALLIFYIWRSVNSSWGVLHSLEKHLLIVFCSSRETIKSLKEIISDWVRDFFSFNKKAALHTVGLEFKRPAGDNLTKDAVELHNGNYWIWCFLQLDSYQGVQSLPSYHPFDHLYLASLPTSWKCNFNPHPNGGS